MYVDIYSFLSRVINKILRYFEGRGARVSFSWYLDWFFLKWLSLLLKDIMTRHFRFVIILSIISFIFVDHALYIIHEFIYFFYVFFFLHFCVCPYHFSHIIFSTEHEQCGFFYAFNSLLSFCSNVFYCLRLLLHRRKARHIYFMNILFRPASFPQLL